MIGIESLHSQSCVMRDLISIAWLIDPEWVPSELVCKPVPGADRRRQYAPGRHLMREGHAVARDAVFGDFFRKLEAAS